MIDRISSKDFGLKFVAILFGLVLLLEFLRGTIFSCYLSVAGFQIACGIYSPILPIGALSVFYFAIAFKKNYYGTNIDILKKPGLSVAAFIIGLVALFNLMRVIKRFELNVAGFDVPLWINIVLFIVSGTLSIWLYLLAKK